MFSSVIILSGQKNTEYSCTWIYFNIFLSTIYLIWCTVRYTVRQTHCSLELALRNTDFHSPENQFFPALMMYGSWDKRCNRHSFLSFCAILNLLTTTWKIKILKKRRKKKIWRYYHFTLVYDKWWSYDVWFLRYGVQQTRVSCYFVPFFALLHPLIIQKIKMLKKWKKYLAMASFYTCAPKIVIMWCMLPEIWSATDIIFYHFWSFFAVLPHYWPQKLKFEKM